MAIERAHIRFGTAVITTLILGACAAVPKPPPAGTAANSQLGPRTLASGDCGLFIWTADSARRLVLFTRPGGADAVWHDGASEQVLTVSRAASPAIVGLPSKQSFVSGPVALTYDLRAPQAITQGTRYKSGVLKLKSTGNAGQAWETVMPVVGLSACQY